MSDVAEQTVRIPANVMGLLRQSYDTREKFLDWLLAIGVACALVYAFRDQLRGMVTSNPDPNAGRDPEPEPNMVTNFDADVYTINQPSTRNYINRPGPSATATPLNASRRPSFPGNC